MRRYVFFSCVALLAIAILIMVVGCATLLPKLTLSVAPQAGHPAKADGGLKVRLAALGGTGPIHVNWGDGTGNQEFPNPVATHVYVQQGTYRISAVRGALHGLARVEVLNYSPIARLPFWTNNCGNVFPTGEKVAFNPFFAIRECVNPTKYGIFDADGDEIEIKVSAWRYDVIDDEHTIRREESLFGDNNEALNNKWLPLQMFTWFAGWTGLRPPYPFINPPYAALDCCDPPDLPPDWPDKTGIAYFKMETRDPWGGYDLIQWSISYVKRSCA